MKTKNTTKTVKPVCTLSTKNTAVIYARVSSVGDRQSTERQTLEYCKQNGISTLLVSELSRMGRNAFEVLASVKELLDCGINLYIQKEQFNLLGEDGKPSLFAPIMLATLSTCAQLERENITFRLQSGRKQYVAKGGRLGRKPGSVKTVEQKREEYKDVIALLRKGYVIRDVAKLTRKSVSTVQRVKKEFLPCISERGCNCKIAKRRKLKSRQAEGRWPRAYPYKDASV